jgi:hypothetical protein
VIGNFSDALPAYYKDHNDQIDRKIFALSMMTYAKDIPLAHHSAVFKEYRTKYQDNWEKMAEDVYKKSALSDSSRTVRMLKLLKSGANLKPLLEDPMYKLATSFSEVFDNTLLPEYRALAQQIDHNSRIYLAGLREMQKDKKYYPDANFTFRVTYGKVQGYAPNDGVEYQYLTTLDGVMAKEDSTVEEFTIPRKLKDLYLKKDYDIFGTKINGVYTVPVAFTATNHTSGGNSGSPVLDNLGNLIGLNFDRCWEGTMSDIMYDPSRCRNIAMDSRYLLFIITKYGEAPHLLDEMTLVKN